MTIGSSYNQPLLFHSRIPGSETYFTPCYTHNVHNPNQQHGIVRPISGFLSRLSMGCTILYQVRQTESDAHWYRTAVPFRHCSVPC
jgi:hypothetical protein